MKLRLSGYKRIKRSLKGYMPTKRSLEGTKDAYWVLESSCVPPKYPNMAAICNKLKFQN